MADIGSAVEDIVNILNTNLEDPYKGTRSGSHIFRPEQDLNFTRFLPKGQIKFGLTEPGRPSFGRDRLEDRSYEVHLGYFSGKGHTGSGDSDNLKNEALILHQLELAGSVLRAHEEDIRGIHLSVSEIIDPPALILNQNVYLGVLTLNLKERK